MKTPTKSSEDISGYLIDKAKASLKSGDPWMAKSWHLTGASLYPDSLAIQHERYQLAKSEQDVVEANIYFCQLLTNRNAAESVELKKEQNLIVDAIKADKRTDEQNFLWKLFNGLSSNNKYSLLMEVATELKDNFPELCKLMLFTLDLFPERLREDGSKLMEIASRAEASDAQNGDNYRKMLVFEVLPLILSPKSNFEFESFAQLEWNLLRAFSFLVQNSFLSTSRPNQVLCDQIEAKLADVLMLAAAKLKWEPILFESNSMSADIVLTHISNFIDKHQNSSSAIVNPPAEPVAPVDDGPIDLSASNLRNTTPPAVCHAAVDEDTLKQVTYSILFLFLKCLNGYFRETAEKNILVEKYIPGLGSAMSSPVISGPPVPAKKRKLTSVAVSPDKAPRELVTTNKNLKQMFLTAVQCNDTLLGANPAYLKELHRLLALIGVEGSHNYFAFITDDRFFRAQYEELIKETQTRALEGTPDAHSGLKSCLQVMSAAIMLYDYQVALTHAFFAVDLIKNLAAAPAFSLAAVSRPRTKSAENVTPMTRQLYFIEANAAEVLAFSVDILTTCLKSMVLMSLKPNDIGLGHLIVLTQFQWPKYVDLFLQCVAAIQAPLSSLTGRGASASHRFTYINFFDYVFVPDILEEFMSLASDDHLVLELSSGIGAKPGTKSMTTRGVNKGAKEEVRSALVAQMMKSKAAMDGAMFVEFILKEMRTLNTF